MPNPTSKPGLKAYWQYHFDRTIAGGTGTLMLWLAVISAAVMALAAVFLVLGIQPSDVSPGETPSYGDSFWTTVGVALDPGAVDNPGWAYRIVMLAVAIIGILIVSTIIGVLTSGIEGKLDDLRRGRSLVLEEGHTIILGWSTKIAAAVQELAIANESCRRAVIAVLADRDKVEMEEYLADRVENLGPTEIICRRGDPCDLADLAIVRPEFARSAILFAGEGDDGDALVLKRTLALQRSSERSGRGCPIIAEVQDHENAMAVARVGHVQVIEPSELVTRVLLQAARQPGLSLVYDELLSFRGCELYFHHDDSLTGRTFGDAAMCLPRAAAIGIATTSGGWPVLNPPIDRVLVDGDRLIVVAADDADIAEALPKPLAFDGRSIASPPDVEVVAERYLVLGWHRWAPILIRELDALLADGSAIHIVFDPDSSDGPSDDLMHSMENVSVTVEPTNTTRRAALGRLDLSDVDKVVLLAYRDTLDPQSADSRTLLTLIHLRELISETGRSIGIATELLDARNRALASRGREDDFVASEELVSNVMVQLSENERLAPVLEELLTAEGSELHLRPASHYVLPDTPTPFGGIVQEGLRRGECVIGVLDRDPSKPLPDLRMAIDKREDVTLGVEDAVVVVAED